MEQIPQGPKEPLMMPGPSFSENGGWWSKFVKWISRNRSNIILSIIGALIIAGGIYLYSNYQASNFPNDQEKQAQEQQNDGTVKPGDVKIGQDKTTTGQTTIKEKAEVVKREGGKVTVKAQKGAGITHLARKATREYLELNPDLKSKVTPEHKVYIEDYIKDKTGSYMLKVGQELSFDEALIKEAIDQSQKLTQGQLKNLSKYVSLAPSLSQ